jgi:hypothetical protein
MGVGGPARDGPPTRLRSQLKACCTVNVACARPEHRLRLFRDSPDIDGNRVENSLRSFTQQPSPKVPQFTVHWQLNRPSTVHRHSFADRIRADTGCAETTQCPLERELCCMLCSPVCVWLSALADRIFPRAGKGKVLYIFTALTACEPKDQLLP